MLLNNSQAAYNDKVTKHKDLLSIAGAKDEALDDAHIALKLLQTLPVIEYYQKNSFPTTASIQGLINEYDKLLKKIDKMPN